MSVYYTTYIPSQGCNVLLSSHGLHFFYLFLIVANLKTFSFAKINHIIYLCKRIKRSCIYSSLIWNL